MEILKHFSTPFYSMGKQPYNMTLKGVVVKN